VLLGVFSDYDICKFHFIFRTDQIVVLQYGKDAKRQRCLSKEFLDNTLIMWKHC